MKIRNIVLLIVSILPFLPKSAKAQRDSIALTSILEKTARYSSEHPIEKVFVHFDKPYYALGDTIWLKAYVTSDLHTPTILSKIVYIDLVNEQRVLTGELKLPVIHGCANGWIALDPKSFGPGNYHVRAYTRWMRNFDEAYFFNRTLSIGSSAGGQVIPAISFHNNIGEKNSHIQATVSYKDEQGKPYGNKKVSWRISNDDDVIGKGKGETDAAGRLEISLSTDKTSELSSATVNTDLELEEKKVISQRFPLQTSASAVDFQFFPEGGYLIDGLRSRVAFKAVRPDGHSMEVKGTVTDNTGTVVASFSSQHLGMGVFAMQPDEEKSYRANVIFADGSHGSFDLPTARTEGITLSASNAEPDTLDIKITANDAYLQRFRNRAFYVLAQSNGVTCYAAQTILKNSSYAARIPKSKFPTGIVQVTLFSYKGSPLSERLVFIRHDDQLLMRLGSAHSSYGRRERVSLDVSARSDDRPQEGNFSISVINESLAPASDNDELTILNHLLLTSDLRGYVEAPNYYFLHRDQQAAADLDVLMLTQGYRRFSYRSIISDRVGPLKYLPEAGIEISGTLRSATGIPVSRGIIQLFIPDKNFSTQTQTDMNGNFRFYNIIVADSSKVSLSARNNPGGSSLVLTVDPLTGPPSSLYTNPAGQLTNMDSTMHRYLENNRKQLSSVAHVQALGEVVIKASAAPKKVSHTDFPTLAGLSPIPDHLVHGDVFRGCPVFAQCLNTSALGLTYDNYNFYISRDYSAGNKSTPVAIYVSGMAVDYNYLMNVNPDMVESVEIFLNDGFSGINKGTGTKGVLEVNLKKQPKGEKITKEQLMDLMPKSYEGNFSPGGYSASRQFYSPRYNLPGNRATGPDLRSTIYWSPAVITDNKGNASVDFYNADVTGTYKAIIQGITKDGRLGWAVYRFEVQ